MKICVPVKMTNDAWTDRLSDSTMSNQDFASTEYGRVWY